MHCASGHRVLCSRFDNFCRTDAGLTSKLGRISLAVISEPVVGCCSMSRDVAEKLADHAHTHTQYHVTYGGSTLPNKYEVLLDA